VVEVNRRSADAVSPRAAAFTTHLFPGVIALADLSIQNVQKSYGRHAVIHGINVNVADGEFAVLVGPSGCGKSTLPAHDRGSSRDYQLGRDPRGRDGWSMNLSPEGPRYGDGCFKTMRSTRT